MPKNAASAATSRSCVSAALICSSSDRNDSTAVGSSFAIAAATSFATPDHDPAAAPTAMVATDGGPSHCRSGKYTVGSIGARSERYTASSTTPTTSYTGCPEPGLGPTVVNVAPSAGRPPKNRRSNVRLTMATPGEPGRSRLSKSRPADRRTPKVPNHPGLSTLTHVMRSRCDSAEPGGTAIIVFIPARAIGVVNDTTAADTPGT